MRRIKKVIFIFLSIICLVFGTKILWNVLIDTGYIPFTEEYDKRVYLKRYEKCKDDFELLIEEIDMYKEHISKEEFDRLVFSREDMKWKIYLFMNDEPVTQKEVDIVNNRSIEKIQNCYNDVLIKIGYKKKSNEYVFRIGEYYRIIVSEDGVTVE